MDVLFRKNHEQTAGSERGFMMTIDESLKKLDALQRKMAAYSHAAGLIYFDGATTAPRGTAANRGETLAVLSEESYKLSAGEETGALLDFLHENSAQLAPAQRRMVELLRKDFIETRAVPMEEYVAYQRLTNEAEDVWHRAKERDDYAAFAPYIDRIVATQRRMARYVEPDTDPYDHRLGRFEEGLTRAACDAFFETLRARLAPLIRRVQAAPQLDDGCLRGHFPIEAQRALSEYLMDVIGLDRAHCGIAETEHPFTTSFSKYDVRITTHYHEENVSWSMYSVIHEGGHALYEANIADEYAYTCLGEAVSMAIHESQSRFMENIIGRSRAFVSLIAPRLRTLFPQLRDVTDEALYRAVNRAEPSLIRTEADELTYCMHIMIRYELEKKLFAGDVTARDLPDAWNAMYREYLGIDVPTNREGVLQDSHWSGGLFGYFPSYALGSAYGAQMLAKMRGTIDVDACVARGTLAPVTDWLRERIWRHGSLLKPGALFEQAVGAPFDPGYYVDYLAEKYMALYGLK